MSNARHRARAETCNLSRYLCMYVCVCVCVCVCVYTYTYKCRGTQFTCFTSMQLLICQYSYFSTRKASKQSTSTHTHTGIGIDHNSTLFLSAFGMRLGAQISFTPKRRVTYHGTLLRCQHLCVCTSKSSKAGKLLPCGSHMRPKCHLARMLTYADVC